MLPLRASWTRSLSPSWRKRECCSSAIARRCSSLMSQGELWSKVAGAAPIRIPLTAGTSVRLSQAIAQSTCPMPTRTHAFIQMLTAGQDIVRYPMHAGAQ